MAALGLRRVTDIRGELEAVLRELYTLLARHRAGIKLLDRCAADYPELASIWFGSGREGALALFRDYIEDRVRGRRLVELRSGQDLNHRTEGARVRWAILVFLLAKRPTRVNRRPRSSGSPAGLEPNGPPSD